MSMQHQEAIARSINSELSLNSSSVAEALLRRNLLIYGVGGLIATFVGIKLIDMLITAVRLA